MTLVVWFDVCLAHCQFTKYYAIRYIYMSISNMFRAVLELVNWQYWLLVLSDFPQSSVEGELYLKGSVYNFHLFPRGIVH